MNHQEVLGLDEVLCCRDLPWGLDGFDSPTRRLNLEQAGDQQNAMIAWGQVGPVKDPKSEIHAAVQTSCGGDSRADLCHSLKPGVKCWRLHMCLEYIERLEQPVAGWWFYVAVLPCNYEIPSKFALIKYVLECASNVGCGMKHAKTIGGSQKNDTVFACAYLRILWCGHTFCLQGSIFSPLDPLHHEWVCAHAVGWLDMTLYYFTHLGGLLKLGTE